LACEAIFSHLPAVVTAQLSRSVGEACNARRRIDNPPQCRHECPMPRAIRHMLILQLGGRLASEVLSTYFHIANAPEHSDCNILWSEKLLRDPLNLFTADRLNAL
jgi:hypothetical protein